MGLEDFTAETDEKMTDSVVRIKKVYDDFNSMLPERFEFMERHEEVADGGVITEYSNGTGVFTDYNSETVRIERK